MGYLRLIDLCRPSFRIPYPICIKIYFRSHSLYNLRAKKQGGLRKTRIVITPYPFLPDCKNTNSILHIRLRSHLIRRIRAPQPKNYCSRYVPELIGFRELPFPSGPPVTPLRLSEFRLIHNVGSSVSSAMHLRCSHIGKVVFFTFPPKYILTIKLTTPHALKNLVT